MDRTDTSRKDSTGVISLNPYSNGIWIEPKTQTSVFDTELKVLILILMEYG